MLQTTQTDLLKPSSKLDCGGLPVGVFISIVAPGAFALAIVEWYAPRWSYALLNSFGAIALILTFSYLAHSRLRRIKQYKANIPEGDMILKLLMGVCIFEDIEHTAPAKQLVTRVHKPKLFLVIVAVMVILLTIHAISAIFHSFGH